MLTRTQVNFGDKAKVTRSALLGTPQVGVFFGVGINDSTVGENNFPVLDHVAGESMLVAVEGVLIERVSHISTRPCGINLHQRRW